MKAFAYLTAVVLAAIGIGVGLLSGLPNEARFRTSTTTTQPRTSVTTPKQIDAFVARALRADRRNFVASYETTEAGSHFSSTVRVAQLSFPKHFMFASYLGTGGGFEEVFFWPTPSPRDAGSSGIYTCGRTSPADNWSCSLLGGGMGGSMLMGDYLPSAMFSGLQTLADTEPAVAFDEMISGRRMSCLRFDSGNPDGGTVCLLASGVIGYFSVRLVTSPEFEGTATLKTLSFKVTPVELTLPATVTAPPCRSDDLTVTAHQGSGAYGHETVVVVFANMTTSACEMNGYPTAWFVSSSGVRVGLKSGHESAPPPTTVVLGVEQSASTTVWTADPLYVSNTYDCVPVTPAGVRVVPPNQAVSLLTPISVTPDFRSPIRICSSHPDVEITPVVAGSAQGPP